MCPRDSKKNDLRPHLSQYWVIPPDHNAEFVAKMEDVLELYEQAYDPEAPMVCMDEASKQLVRDVEKPIPAAPGRPERIDYEYERNGTASIFMFTEPLKGSRWTEVADHRRRTEWAHVVKDMLDNRYPQARVVRLVMDNLNTHGVASFYEAFEPAEARRLAKRLEIHHTPKHGSWLNVAEIELRVLSVQCLDRRISDKESLAREVAAWEASRNSVCAAVDWQFTTHDARRKLKRLYPKFQG